MAMQTQKEHSGIRKGCGVAAMQAAHVNTMEERKDSGFATMQAVQEITQAPEKYHVRKTVFDIIQKTNCS